MISTIREASGVGREAEHSVSAASPYPLRFTPYGGVAR
jgi:hypothetical protein